MQVQMCRCADVQMCIGAEQLQRCRVAKVLSCRGDEVMQRSWRGAGCMYGGAEVRGAEVLRC